MIISAQPQLNVVTPVSALGRPVVGNENIEAKATALPPVEETSASDKTLNRPILQAVLVKPDAALSAALSAASSAALSASASLSGSATGLSGSAKAAIADKPEFFTDKPKTEQKSLAAIGRESLAKALAATDTQPAAVSTEVSDQPIAAPNSAGKQGGIDGTQAKPSADSNGQAIQAQGGNQSNSPQTERDRQQIAQTGFTEAELKLIQELSARDREVRAHEQAHSAVGGDIAGSPSYTYKRGPDGVLYAVGGEVSISVSEVPNNPQATLRKAEKIQRAALAPADPSPQDRRVAAIAARMAAQARAELAAQSSEAIRSGEPNASSAQSVSSSSSTDSTDASDSISRSRTALSDSTQGYTRGYISERISLQDPTLLNDFYAAKANDDERQGRQVDFLI